MRDNLIAVVRLLAGCLRFKHLLYCGEYALPNMDYLQEHGETDVVRTIGNGSLHVAGINDNGYFAAA